MQINLVDTELDPTSKLRGTSNKCVIRLGFIGACTKQFS